MLTDPNCRSAKFEFLRQLVTVQVQQIANSMIVRLLPPHHNKQSVTPSTAAQWPPVNRSAARPAACWCASPLRKTLCCSDPQPLPPCAPAPSSRKPLLGLGHHTHQHLLGCQHLTARLVPAQQHQQHELLFPISGQTPQTGFVRSASKRTPCTCRKSTMQIQLGKIVNYF